MRSVELLGLTVVALFVFIVPAAAQKRKAVSGAEVTGTFRSKEGDQFLIEALGKGKLKIEFSGSRKYKTASGMSAGLGFAEGEARIKADVATFVPAFAAEQNSRCTITLGFAKPGTLAVTRDGGSTDCGFNWRVFADGLYRKTSGKKPVFGKNQL